MGKVNGKSVWKEDLKAWQLLSPPPTSPNDGETKDQNCSFLEMLEKIEVG